MPSFSALPGFRDFYPPEFAIRAHITNTWRETARRYGYEEYDGPPLEPLELYTEKSGDEIVRQLYSFEDKGQRAVALRPEMTPTFARMVGARAGGMRKPIRWFSIPQLFRYERTQRGRLREHFQWNVDLVGEPDVGADAEVLAIALDSLRQLGLSAADIVARVNDRRLLEALLTGIGIAPEKLGAAFAVVDKLGRDSRENSEQRLRQDAGLEAAGVAQLFDIFAAEQLADLRTSFGAMPGVSDQIDRLERYLGALADLGLADYVRFDPKIVRGLAYYTGIVFEIFDRQGELRAICGGGRYDALLRTVSSTDLPACGFGMGDVVLAELLRERNLLPAGQPQLDFYVIAVSENERVWQRRVAQALREQGYSASYAFGTSGVGKQLKDADLRGAVNAIILGPDEVARGIAVVKELSSGRQREIELDRLLAGSVADEGGDG